MLYRFCAGLTSSEENNRIAAWLDANPEQGQKRLDEAHAVCLLSIMCEDTAAERPARRIWLRRVGRIAAGIAAALFIGFGLNYAIFTHRMSEWSEQLTTIEAPAGQRIRFTLSDGSVIDLNSGSRIVYPSIFTGRERRVKLSGEAMFDVGHDPQHPFVVETFACDVQVLGTRFNVQADEARNRFSTALLRGSVAVSSKLSDERVVMRPNSVVQLENGHLHVSQIINTDDYLWTEGIISVSGMPFDLLVEKLEKSYDVKIVIDRPTLPEVGYQRCKIRISDGIDHALKVLQMASDFTYRYDEQTNRILIQ